MKIVLWAIVLVLQLVILGSLVNQGILSQSSFDAVMNGTSSVYFIWGMFSFFSAMSGRSMAQGEKLTYTIIVSAVSLSLLDPGQPLIVVPSAIVALVVAKMIGGFQRRKLDPA